MADENLEHALPFLWDDPAADDTSIKDFFALIRALQKFEKTCTSPIGKFESGLDEEFWTDAKADYELN